jgi:hypothetical protein
LNDQAQQIMDRGVLWIHPETAQYYPYFPEDSGNNGQIVNLLLLLTKKRRNVIVDEWIKERKSICNKSSKVGEWN